MNLVLQFFTLLGAMCMFLYGMTLMSEGLQKAAGDRMRAILASMTSTRAKGILTGIIITALIQSSSGTTVMIVSMVNAGLIALSNAIGVIMGANIGTTITAWIISLFGFSYDIAVFAIPFIAVGFMMTYSQKGKTKNIGEFIIGLALLLIGLATMKNSVPDLNKYPDTLAFVKNLTSYGFLSVLIFVALGTVLTIILQASSASMALTMVFVANGWIDFPMACGMVFGENIGTTITANIAATVANYSAKRAALVHSMYNIIGVIIALILFYPFLNLIAFFVTSTGLPNPMEAFGTGNALEITPDKQKALLFGICFLHSTFNITTMLILVWFIPVLEKIVKKIVPTPKGTEETFKLKFIQGGPLSTAELSLDAAKQEIINFAEVCYKGFGHIRDIINTSDPDVFAEKREKLSGYEDITDRLEYNIASFLNEITRGDISDSSSQRVRSMYKVIGELESLGDSGDAIGRILTRRNEHQKEFDADTLKKINKMMDLLENAYKAMLDNLKSSYIVLPDITNAISAENKINEYRNILREEHIINIEKNDNYNYQIGVFYMDIIAAFEKMGDFIINISEAQINKNA